MPDAVALSTEAAFERLPGTVRRGAPRIATNALFGLNVVATR
jgi:hypothetical protein